MNEKEFGEKIARMLESGIQNIDNGAKAKLRGARLAALAHYKQEAHSIGFAWAGPMGEHFENLFNQRSLLWAPLLTGLLALGIGSYLQYHYSQSDSDDVDAFLLAGDLPVHAYIDKDFDIWLNGSSR